MIIRKKECLHCSECETHPTGSQIWLTCKLQDGWRDINSVCNLEGQKELTKKDVEVKV